MAVGVSDDDELVRKMRIARKEAMPADLFKAALPAVILGASPGTDAKQLAARTKLIAEACMDKLGGWGW